MDSHFSSSSASGSMDRSSFDYPRTVMSEEDEGAGSAPYIDFSSSASHSGGETQEDVHGSQYGGSLRSMSYLGGPPSASASGSGSLPLDLDYRWDLARPPPTTSSRVSIPITTSVARSTTTDHTPFMALSDSEGYVASEDESAPEVDESDAEAATIETGTIDTHDHVGAVREVWGKGHRVGQPRLSMFPLGIVPIASVLSRKAARLSLAAFLIAEVPVDVDGPPLTVTDALAVLTLILDLVRALTVSSAAEPEAATSGSGAAAVTQRRDSSAERMKQLIASLRLSPDAATMRDWSEYFFEAYAESVEAPDDWRRPFALPMVVAQALAGPEDQQEDAAATEARFRRAGEDALRWLQENPSVLAWWGRDGPSLVRDGLGMTPRTFDELVAVYSPVSSPTSSIFNVYHLSQPLSDARQNALAAAAISPSPLNSGHFSPSLLRSIVRDILNLHYGPIVEELVTMGPRKRRSIASGSLRSGSPRSSIFDTASEITPLERRAISHRKLSGFFGEEFNGAHLPVPDGVMRSGSARRRSRRFSKPELLFQRRQESSASDADSSPEIDGPYTPVRTRRQSSQATITRLSAFRAGRRRSSAALVHERSTTDPINFADSRAINRRQSVDSTAPMISSLLPGRRRPSSLIFETASHAPLDRIRSNDDDFEGAPSSLGASVSSRAPLLGTLSPLTSPDPGTEPPANGRFAFNTHFTEAGASPKQMQYAFAHYDDSPGVPISPEDRLLNNLSSQQRRNLVKQRSKLLRVLGEPVSPTASKSSASRKSGDTAPRKEGVSVTREVVEQLSDPGSPTTSPRSRWDEKMALRRQSMPSPKLIWSSPTSDSSPPTASSDFFSPIAAPIRRWNTAGQESQVEEEVLLTSDTSPEFAAKPFGASSEAEISPKSTYSFFAQPAIELSSREEKRKRLDKLHRYLGERVDPFVLDGVMPLPASPSVKSPNIGSRAGKFISQRSASIFNRKGPRLAKGGRDPRWDTPEVIPIELNRNEDVVIRTSEDSVASMRKLRKLESMFGELPPQAGHRKALSVQSAESAAGRSRIYRQSLSSLHHIADNEEILEDLAASVYGLSPSPRRDSSPEILQQDDDSPPRPSMPSAREQMIRRAHKLQRIFGTTRGEVLDRVLADIRQAVQDDEALDDEERDAILSDCNALTRSAL